MHTVVQSEILPFLKNCSTGHSESASLTDSVCVERMDVLLVGFLATIFDQQTTLFTACIHFLRFLHHARVRYGLWQRAFGSTANHTQHEPRSCFENYRYNKNWVTALCCCRSFQDYYTYCIEFLSKLSSSSTVILVLRLYCLGSGWLAWPDNLFCISTRRPTSAIAKPL